MENGTLKSTGNILIDILAIGKDSLENSTEITPKEVECKLREWKYTEDLIKKGMLLFFSENYKTRYGEEKFWLSSDGHIRLLQYENLKSAEDNLKLAKDSLKKADETLKIAFWTLLVSIVMPFLIALLSHCLFNNNDSIGQQHEDIMKLLNQITNKQDSIILTIRDVQKTIVLKDSILLQTKKPTVPVNKVK